MKTTFKNFGLILFSLIFSSGYSLEICNPLNEVESSDMLVKKKKWTGSWNYTVQDVPVEYSTGVLHISKKKKVYTVELELPEGNLPTDNVRVDKNKLTFSVDIEGSTVDVALIMDGDSFKGESNTPDGTFMLEGNRRI
ncbi:hypothetical protein [uncultured Eudoraea sp.]|uniref:hypothetical protein n=1 Tax=uncultured Eudoraea sp. TaxID=1035614 RepID=UPI002623391F|nr:hypothetical protein [uncultured Eudoraea sp.]